MVSIVDDFESLADGDPLSGDADWSVFGASGSGVPTMDQHDDHSDGSQVADMSTLGDAYAVHGTQVGSDDHHAELEVFIDSNTTAGNFAGPIARGSASSMGSGTFDGYGAFAYGLALGGGSESFVVGIFRIDNDTPTELANTGNINGTYAPGTLHTLRLEVDGSTLTAFVDGNQELQTTDGTYATGQHVGFRMVREELLATSQPFVDNFDADVLAGGTTPVQSDLAASWDVAAEVQANLAATWGTLDAVLVSLPATFDVLAAVQSDLTAQWDIAAQVTAALPASWDVAGSLTPVQSDLAASWDVAAEVAAALPAQWDVADTVASGLAASWDVLAAVQADLAASWDVAQTGTVVASLAASWDVTAEVQADLPVTYTTLDGVLAELTAEWDVAQTTQADLSATWDLAAAVQADLPASWDVSSEIPNGVAPVSGTVAVLDTGTTVAVLDGPTTVAVLD